MKKIFVSITLLILLGYAAGFSSLPQKGNGTEENNKAPNQKQNINHQRNCKSCHESEYPTPNDPGLRGCPRSNMVSVYHPPEEAPDVLVINEMSDKYTGVVFPHKIHAEMSGMSSGCRGCHHYNTEGPVLNCRKCHENTRKREDVSVPDLKAAYHRQCMSCHKQWSGTNGCNDKCHMSKSSAGKDKIELIRGKSHPELVQPDKLVWETNSKINKIVTFYHDEHINLFRIECTGCHTQESCIKCHSIKSPETKPVKIEKSIEEHHKPCSNCHVGNSCRKCHNSEEMKPFDHTRNAGWSLNGHHSGLECSNCHGSRMPYKKLDRSCVSCHKDFAESFDHKLKGLVFSEAHTEIECEGCHQKRDFNTAPVCNDCHDDKKFPSDLPGKMVKK